MVTGPSEYFQKFFRNFLNGFGRQLTFGGTAVAIPGGNAVIPPRIPHFAA
jgi:hypothetical protein